MQRHGAADRRTDITALGLYYVAGIGPNTSVWPPGEAPVPPQSRIGRGRPQTRLQRGQRQPISVKTLALSLPPEAWQTITWREGTADWLSSRFARRRMRPAHRDNLLSEVRAEEWLLIEWPEDQTEPTKYWFSTLPEDAAFDQRVRPHLAVLSSARDVHQSNDQHAQRLPGR